MSKGTVTRKYDFAVLIYPPFGKPRVVELPRLPKGIKPGALMFKKQADAEAALEKFLTENPEYRRWENGSIQPEGRA